ncbi:hypothetical protein C8J57DRAFT_1091237 [Mycena rebaudengoi]|nr:hypothetical protein C8J57DRAFT_1091237 [Mycena rebaudengoi]
MYALFRKTTTFHAHVHSASQRDQIIEWYSPLNFFQRQDEIFDTGQPGTGEWLQNDAKFRSWESGIGKILWCRGIPGAGKTVLVSIIVSHLHAGQNRDVGVAVIYLNHKETDAQPLSLLLTGLWRQLVFENDIPSKLHSPYNKHREKRTRPSIDDDHNVLVSTIQEYSKVFILVDALDEYPERLRDALLRRISALGPTVNLLLTSRPYFKFDHIVSKDIDIVEIRATEDDVRLYVSTQISLSSRLRSTSKTARALEKKLRKVSLGVVIECEHLVSFLGIGTVSVYTVIRIRLYGYRNRTVWTPSRIYTVTVGTCRTP